MFTILIQMALLVTMSLPNGPSTSAERFEATNTAPTKGGKYINGHYWSDNVPSFDRANSVELLGLNTEGNIVILVQRRVHTYALEYYNWDFIRVASDDLSGHGFGEESYLIHAVLQDDQVHFVGADYQDNIKGAKNKTLDRAYSRSYDLSTKQWLGEPELLHESEGIRYKTHSVNYNISSDHSSGLELLFPNCLVHNDNYSYPEGWKNETIVLSPSLEPLSSIGLVPPRDGLFGVVQHFLESPERLFSLYQQREDALGEELEIKPSFMVGIEDDTEVWGYQLLNNGKEIITAEIVPYSEDQLVLSGFYHIPKAANPTQGFFSRLLDRKSMAVLDSTDYPIAQERFAENTFYDHEDDQASLLTVKILEQFIEPDNTRWVVAERRFGRLHASGARGELIVLRADAEGEIQWITHIPRKVVSAVSLNSMTYPALMPNVQLREDGLHVRMHLNTNTKDKFSLKKVKKTKMTTYDTGLAAYRIDREGHRSHELLFDVDKTPGHSFVLLDASVQGPDGKEVFLASNDARQIRFVVINEKSE